MGMGRYEIGTKLGTSLRKIQDKTWDRPWQEVYYVPYKKIACIYVWQMQWACEPHAEDDTNTGTGQTPLYAVVLVGL